MQRGKFSYTVLLAISCLSLASATRSGFPGRSLLGTGATAPIAATANAASTAPPPVCPNSQFGVDYPGNDMPNGQIDNVPSPGACCTLCGQTPGCVAYTWVAVDGTNIALPLDPREANGGAIVNRCYLKNALGPATNSDFTVSGKLQQTQTCPTLMTGKDLPGNDLKFIDNVASPASCCATCSSTPGCHSFTYITATDPNNAGAAVAQRCFLKFGGGTNPTPYAQCTSGMLVPTNGTATATPTYRPPMQVQFHSQDEKDSMSKSLEAYFLPQGNSGTTTSPGFYVPDFITIPVLQVFLLTPPAYDVNLIKQVDWYFHKQITAFTDPNLPPVPSQNTATSAPFYLGKQPNAAGGQGPAFDLQQLRLSHADSCGATGSTGSTYCTATAVITFKDGSKVFGARNTFRAAVVHSEG